MMLEVIVAILVGKVQVGPDMVQYDYLVDNTEIVSYIVQEPTPIK